MFHPLSPLSLATNRAAEVVLTTNQQRAIAQFLREIAYELRFFLFPSVPKAIRWVAFRIGPKTTNNGRLA